MARKSMARSGPPSQSEVPMDMRLREMMGNQGWMQSKYCDVASWMVVPLLSRA